ncbi:hypothetical protein SPBR_08911 [Sporothrix brasiliensis 5110]|uniref:Uncharacterized protein n=1 Tax=Sporothrix brasiliensis 5110 TaxID=1398154 RepID=A0A0C2EKG5_9PEZI|nr:uncharacterized protein SPBR_08911 [Sporothrix brasiliensis 5110]KIH86579.1 hypothetical protein SPBR_08911 [Sporothrix brasiliensis 5110]
MLMPQPSLRRDRMQGGESGHGTGGVAWNEHMVDAPKLIEEATLQLLAWHANLALSNGPDSNVCVRPSC